MVESQLKRQREENDVQGYDECVAEEDYSKRHKSYNDILSILELQEEDEPNQDLSDIFTSLQQELSSSDSTAVCGGSGGSVGSGGDVSGSEAESVDETCGSATPDRNSGGDSSNNESIEEDERVRVMRHLLEASDDELGIPNRVEESGEEETGSGDKQQLFLSGDWKWQFEDDAADYYYNFMHLQSELFI